MQSLPCHPLLAASDNRLDSRLDCRETLEHCAAHLQLLANAIKTDMSEECAFAFFLQLDSTAQVLLAVAEALKQEFLLRDRI